MTDNLALDANIYVLGFPKSGNTWLVRLLARYLNMTVERTPMGGGGVDIASAVNQEIAMETRSKIYKVHWLPQQFQADIESAPKYVIYICRDPRDVFVSSFFYFSYTGDTKYVVKKSTERGVVASLRHLAGRYKMSRYLRHFVTEGVGTLGTWAHHVESWRKFMNTHAQDTKGVLVRYEDLLGDTAGALQRVVRELELKERPADVVQEIVRQESIGELQKNSDKMHEALGTFGQEYFRKFFRKGKRGDWRRYLSRRQRRRIESVFGGVMTQMKYELESP